MTRIVVVDNTVPPVAAAYHLSDVPVAVNDATVAPEQKDWAAVPVGAAGGEGCVFITTFAEATDVHPDVFFTVYV